MASYDTTTIITNSFVGEGEGKALSTIYDTYARSTSTENGHVEAAGPSSGTSVSLPGSAIDHIWRISMVTFLLGAIPQAIKVFGMKNILVTQIYVGSLVAVFTVPEFFRLVAGPVVHAYRRQRKTLSHGLPIQLTGCHLA